MKDEFNIVIPPGSSARALYLWQQSDELVAAIGEVAGAGPVTVAIADRCGRPDDHAPAFRLARESIELMLKLGRGGVSDVEWQVVECDGVVREGAFAHRVSLQLDVSDARDVRQVGYFRVATGDAGRAIEDLGSAQAVLLRQALERRHRVEPAVAIREPDVLAPFARRIAKRVADRADQPGEGRLESLLLLWQERRDGGTPLTAEELCRDCPELAAPLIADLHDAPHLVEAGRVGVEAGGLAHLAFAQQSADLGQFAPASDEGGQVRGDPTAGPCWCAPPYPKCNRACTPR